MKIPFLVNRNTTIITASFILLILLSLSGVVSAFSIREFLGLEEPAGGKKPAAQTNPVKKPSAEPAATTPEVVDYTVDFEEIQKIVAVIDENQRKAILADEKAFTNFIRNEAANKSMLAAAHANGIDQDERNLFIAQRGAENIIREIYLKKLAATKIPADFPGEEQMKSYYEQNKDKFVLEERTHVWQIFLPIKDAADRKETELLKKQAEAIVTELNNNKTDFAAAAEKYSNPPGSKYSGGYMGLVKISDVKPDIRQPLLALPPDKVSDPITTAEGIHILKRGKILPAQPIRYDEVQGQIRKLMLTQLNNNFRQEVIKQASEIYPVDITDKTIEEWRLKLRTNVNAETSTGAAREESR